MDDFDFVQIIKDIIGDEQYKELLVKITDDVLGKMKNKINLINFYDDIVNKYSFIILIIGVSKKIEIETLKIETDKAKWNIQLKEFVKKYEKFIRIIENKRFEKIKQMLY